VNLFTSLSLIVKKSLKQHAFSTLTTALSVGLAAGLLMSIFVINQQAYNAFTGGPFGFDAVLGARGSKIQLVLNAVFHLETSPGNIPWNLYKEIEQDPFVKLAIPYAVGDNYEGFRIVGTIIDNFTKFEYKKGQKYKFKKGGRVFHPKEKEAVIGSIVAKETGLKVGSVFSPSHGISFTGEDEHEEQFRVAGILHPSNTAADKVVWIPINEVYHMEGHVLGCQIGYYTPKEGVPIPDDFKEVSAVLLDLKSPQAGFRLDREINKERDDATLAWPIGLVMHKLFDKIGWINKILSFISYLVIIVASASILTSVYNTISARQREFAILRALGAHRWVVFLSIVLECMVISFLGIIIGFIIYGGILSLAIVIIRVQTGILLSMIEFHPILILAPVGMIILGALAGILPAIKAYSTDVATNIAPEY